MLRDKGASDAAGFGKFARDELGFEAHARRFDLSFADDVAMADAGTGFSDDDDDGDESDFDEFYNDFGVPEGTLVLDDNAELWRADRLCAARPAANGSAVGATAHQPKRPWIYGSAVFKRPNPESVYFDDDVRRSTTASDGGDRYRQFMSLHADRMMDVAPSGCPFMSGSQSGFRYAGEPELDSIESPRKRRRCKVQREESTGQDLLWPGCPRK